MKLNLEEKPKNQAEIKTTEYKTKRRSMKKQDFLQKHTINLMYTERERGNNPKYVIPLGVVLFVLIILFTKFMVIDKVGAAMRAEAEIQSVRTQTEALREENRDYEKIKAEYNRYSTAAYNDAELALIGVNHVLTLLDHRILQRADMESCVYENNVLNVAVSGVSLQETAEIVSVLYQDPYVAKVSVSTAATNEKEISSQRVVAELTVQMQHPQKDTKEVEAE